MTTPLWGSPERWKFSHIDSSELVYNGIYPDGRLSRSMTYTALHPDGNSSGSLLKDGDSPMSIPRSLPTMGCTLMVARADPRPIRVFTLMITLRESHERWRLAHVDPLGLAYNRIYRDGRPSRSMA